MSWENPVRGTTLEVIKVSRQVRLNEEAINNLALKWLEKRMKAPPWPAPLHLETSNRRMLLDYLIILDSLNFCFWSRNKSRWEIWHDGEKYTGYYALALALKRFFERKPEKANFLYLREISFEEFRLWFQGGANLLFLKRRWEILRSVSDFFSKEYGNDSRNFLLSANGYLSTLIPRIAYQIPSFNDVTYYNGGMVYLWKRAQILAADVIGAFQGRGLGAFKDPEYLTAFADYKLPQILFHYGILEYTPELREKIQNLVILPAGSPEEIEIRSATIWAVELLKFILNRRGKNLLSYEIDWLLWNESQKEKMRLPHHLTGTIFY